MSIADNLARIREDIHKACSRAGREDNEVRLMAVSKFHPREAVDEAFQAGARLFGENRVQEATTKFADKTTLPAASIHLIGSLQRNKARIAANLFDCIQSLDRNDIIDTLGACCSERAAPLPVLLELNAGEDSKSGYRSVDALLAGADKVMGYKGLRLDGLMTMAPFTDDVAVLRHAFRALADAKRRVETTIGHPLPVLSMGMTNDFTIAVEEGSTLVRIGTAIFGARV
jgi:pyridoxal phosphate enzyme (YggS family)